MGSRQRKSFRQETLTEFLSPEQWLGHLSSPFSYLLHIQKQTIPVSDSATSRSVPLAKWHLRNLYLAGTQEMHVYLTFNSLLDSETLAELLIWGKISLCNL